MAYADEQIAVLSVVCEADGQPHIAKVGVAAAILNRVKTGRWGHCPAVICLRRMQFSEWNDDQADNANLERVAAMDANHPSIVDGLAAWQEAVAGSDPTSGATHFYADGIPAPDWTAGATASAKLGTINFFSNVR